MPVRTILKLCLSSTVIIPTHKPQLHTLSLAIKVSVVLWRHLVLHSWVSFNSSKNDKLLMGLDDEQACSRLACRSIFQKNQSILELCTGQILNTHHIFQILQRWRESHFLSCIESKGQPFFCFQGDKQIFQHIASIMIFINTRNSCFC